MRDRRGLGRLPDPAYFLLCLYLDWPIPPSFEDRVFSQTLA
jgi:hypothetical protein